jgi:hypothetical protein
MNVDQFGLASRTEDHKEGVEGFLARRKPRFRGNRLPANPASLKSNKRRLNGTASPLSRRPFYVGELQPPISRATSRSILTPEIHLLQKKFGRHKWLSPRLIHLRNQPT